MDDYTMALIIIGDMTLTERKLSRELELAQERIAELEDQQAEGNDA